MKISYILREDVAEFNLTAHNNIQAFYKKNTGGSELKKTKFVNDQFRFDFDTCSEYENMRFH